MTDFQKVGEFAVPFSYAIVKIKNAVDSKLGVTLTAEETWAVVEAFKLLKRAPGET